MCRVSTRLGRCRSGVFMMPGRHGIAGLLAFPDCSDRLGFEGRLVFAQRQGGFGPIAQVEGLEKAGDVGFGGMLGDREYVADFAIREPFGHAAKDFNSPASERRDERGIRRRCRVGCALGLSRRGGNQAPAS